MRRLARGGIGVFILGALAALVVLAWLHYHVVSYVGEKYKLLVVVPKERLTFDHTFVELEDLDTIALGEALVVLGKSAAVVASVAAMYVVGTVEESEDRSVALGRLEEQQIYCTWDYASLTCIKL
jgi:hypothetical protein